MKRHTYSAYVQWIAADGVGTTNYRSYSRDHTIGAPGKPEIAGSSDPAFRGNAARYNPEELLVASLSSCHMLWYLHLCSINGITIVDYRDDASGAMEEDGGGGAPFVRGGVQAGSHDGRRRSRQSTRPSRGRASALLHRALRQLSGNGRARGRSNGLNRFVDHAILASNAF